MTLGESLAMTSMLFGLFFGAGNLIFPVSLGQASKDCGKRIRMLLSENCGMMAALVSSRPAGRGDNTVYLYLPKSKEAKCDEMQEEDAKEA